MAVEHTGSSSPHLGERKLAHAPDIVFSLSGANWWTLQRTMPDGSSGDTTRTAGVANAGDGTDPAPAALTAADGFVDASLDGLVPIVYQELRTIAHRHLAMRGAHGATLATTALVHEAYLRLMSGAPSPWRDRTHFLSVAAVAMRHILVDRARAGVGQARRRRNAHHAEGCCGACSPREAPSVRRLT